MGLKEHSLRSSSSFLAFSSCHLAADRGAASWRRRSSLLGSTCAAAAAARVREGGS